MAGIKMKKKGNGRTFFQVGLTVKLPQLLALFSSRCWLRAMCHSKHDKCAKTVNKKKINIKYYLLVILDPLLLSLVSLISQKI